MNEINNYQKQIDIHIQKLGGYWRSISALARLQEEIGELAELMMEDPKNVLEIQEETADIFVISTCLANQYLNRLQEEYLQISLPTNTDSLQKLKSKLSLIDLYFRIQIHAGRIARIINHYDGDKVKKPTEEDHRLGAEIAYLHKYTILFANKLEFNLFYYVDCVLEKSAQRDKNRFSLMHDPTTEPSLSNFQVFIKQTTGAYPNQKLWGNYEWNRSENYDVNIANSVPSFTRFCKCACTERLDGYIFEIHHIQNEGKDLSNLKRVLSAYDDKSLTAENSYTFQGVNFEIKTYRNESVNYFVFYVVS